VEKKVNYLTHDTDKLFSVFLHLQETRSKFQCHNSRFGIRTASHFRRLAFSLSTEDDIIADDDESSKEDFILNAGDLDDEVITEEDEDDLPGWYKLNERVKELRVKYRRSENDTGSPEFQVAGLTERISYLTMHLKEHPKDFSTRRGLVALVNKRRRLLNYLFRIDPEVYRTVVKSLGIRHKAPGRFQTRKELYGRFPLQKPRKYKNKKSED